MTDDEFQAQALIPPCDPAIVNPAIARCCGAMDRTFSQAYAENLRREGKSPKEGDDNSFAYIYAVRAARKAYRAAMPALCGAHDIRDFIACVAHGILLEVFEGSDASKLLYAAQVASAAPAVRPAKKKEF
jgi:hypothetical protein